MNPYIILILAFVAAVPPLALLGSWLGDLIVGLLPESWQDEL
ncbi:hypothetical protein [Microbacterium azadirachtae]|nr:hypothetical protein [Microbacterium azadirachtae]